jgi:hypothetical protein
MMGYLRGTDVGELGVTITITDLPEDIANGYAVVIYTLGNVPNLRATFTVNGVVKHIVSGGNTTFRHPYSGPEFVKAFGGDPNFGDQDFGNYAIFDSLSGRTVHIHGDPSDRADTGV